MPATWRRLAWVDSLRGAALVGMMVYHGAWDLHAFAILQVDPSQHHGWRLFGCCVAGLFLALSGFGLSLAARHGSSARARVLRLGRIAGAAALVSLVTRVAVPEAPIWFGILHCILVTNAIAIGLMPLSRYALLAAAVAAWAAPFAFPGVVGPNWSWTGLAASEPATLDFRPVLPWLAPVLLGVVLGRTALATSPGPAALGTRMLMPLAWAGRHSLAVYLGHQPILIGALTIALGTVPSHDAALNGLRKPEEATAFLRQCHRACMAQGAEEDLCRSTCDCVLTAALSRADGAPRNLTDAAAFCRRRSTSGDR